ncbi:unnamed protein product [Peniophora sp. CBMAI 1063]|nr:unnamed protein product [Peniophora sp. CBMAI 1063]
MYFDLNVPVPVPASIASSSGQASKKGKGKQQQNAGPAPVVAFSPAQITAIEARVDLLVHLGYTVLAFTQTAHSKVDPRTHINHLDPLLSALRRREGIVYLKRLTIILDGESEKGFGLTNTNAPLFAPYDLIALSPLTDGAWQYAVQTHTQPSNLTAHILSIPLTSSRLPYRLKHTAVRTALRNGAVFEISYAGALGTDEEGNSGGASTRRNWWACAREVARATKGRGLIVSSGAYGEAELRAPRDVGNLLTFLELKQDQTHDASTTTPKSLVLRAQTRKTYRAVLSEPQVVIPEGYTQVESPAPAPVTPASTTPASVPPEIPAPKADQANGKKRPREEVASGASTPTQGTQQEGGASKKKKKKNKGGP